MANGLKEYIKYIQSGDNKAGIVYINPQIVPSTSISAQSMFHMVIPVYSQMFDENISFSLVYSSRYSVSYDIHGCGFKNNYFMPVSDNNGNQISIEKPDGTTEFYYLDENDLFKSEESQNCICRIQGGHQLIDKYGNIYLIPYGCSYPQEILNLSGERISFTIDNNKIKEINNAKKNIRLNLLYDEDLEEYSDSLDDHSYLREIDVFVSNIKYNKIKFIYNIELDKHYLSSIEKYDKFDENTQYCEKYNYNIKKSFNSSSYYYDLNNVTDNEYFRYIFDSYNIINCIYHSKEPISLTTVEQNPQSNIDTILVEYGEYPVDSFIPKITDLSTNDYYRYYYRYLRTDNSEYLAPVSHIVRNDKFISKFTNDSREIDITNEFLIQRNDPENLIMNGFFENNLNNWTVDGDVTIKSIIDNAILQHIDSIFGDKVAQFQNNEDEVSSISQIVNLEYFPGDEYVLGFWTSTNDSEDIHENTKVIIKIYYDDNLIESIEQNLIATQSFEFNIISIYKEYNFDKLEIIFNVENNYKVYLDGVFLKKGTYGVHGSKDSNANISSLNSKNKDVNITYDEHNLPIKYSNTYSLFDTTIQYNNKGQIISKNDGITSNTYLYDENNNLCETRINNSDLQDTMCIIYNYDTSNRLCEIEQNNRCFVNMFNFYEQYDELGHYKILKEEQFYDSAYTPTPKKKNALHYSENKLKKYCKYIVENNTFKNLLNVQYEYENDGSCLIRASQSPYFFRHSLDYQTLNNRPASLIIDYTNGSTITYAQETYYYDDVYNRITSIDDDVVETIYNYDQNHPERIIETVLRDNLLPQYNSISYYFEYDIYDRIVSTKFNDNHKFSYVYDSYNKLLETKYMYNNFEYKNMYRYYYDNLSYCGYLTKDYTFHQGYSNILYMKNSDKTTNYFGYNYSLDTSTYMHSPEMQEKFDIYPLNYDLCSLENKKPAIYIRRMIDDKYPPQFVFDDTQMRSVYFANGSTLAYNLTGLSTDAFAFSFNMPTIGDSKYYLFDIENMIYAYIQKDESNINNIIIGACGREYNTNIDVSPNNWYRFALKLDKVDISIDATKKYNYLIAVTVGYKTYNIERPSYIEIHNRKITIGKRSYRDYNYRDISESYPLYGKIEDLIISKVHMSNITDTQLKQDNNIFTNSILYDLLNRKKYDLISRDQDIKSYRSFGYDGDTNIINSLDIYCNNTTLSYTYTYDSGTNNLVKCTKGRKDIEYEYNDLNFLLSEKHITNTASGSECTKSIEYEYNANGNLIKITTKNVAGDIIDTTTFTHLNNHPCHLTKYNDFDVSYFGNRIRDIAKYEDGSVVEGKIFDWYADKLTKCQIYNNSILETEILYEYNPLGQRSRKVVNDEVTDYIYEDNKLIEEITSTHSMKYLYNAEGIYGFIKKTGTTCSYYYYIKNIIGEIIGIINNSGNMVVNYEYDPWGKLLSITGSQATTIGSQNHILYKGYYYDVETGLFMMGHRYYSPELCRFIQPDDIEYLDPSSINGLNLYCYCMNNPIMYFDPSGHMPEWAMWVIGGVLLVGSIALTIATGGAAAGTVLATVHTIATGAMIGGITSAAISTIAGGISYENGVASWDWSGAAKGFMWGSITGVISGAAGSALSNVGSGLAAYGKLGKLGYAGIQGLINSGIAGGLTAGQGLITGGFSWDSVGLSAMFGFAGGAIGMTKWGEGIRNIIVGAGLGLGECSIGEIIEWWQSRQRTNMAYLRFAY